MAKLPPFAMRLHVEPERPNPRHLMPAVDALRRDRVIIYPTDTGYAFGCALSSPKGIVALRRLKGIDAKHKKPLTMLVNELSDVGRYGIMSNEAFRYVRRLLPGPYTMVLRATAEVPRAMKNREHEVGLRMPAHPVCAMLVDLLGEPLLTGSLTTDGGQPELEEPDLLEHRFSPDIDLIVDVGPLWPDPSTVLRFTDTEIQVLREGQGPLPEWAA